MFHWRLWGILKQLTAFQFYLFLSHQQDKQKKQYLRAQTNVSWFIAYLCCFFMCVLVSALLMRSPELSELLPCQWQLDLDPEVGMKEGRIQKTCKWDEFLLDHAASSKILFFFHPNVSSKSVSVKQPFLSHLACLIRSRWHSWTHTPSHLLVLTSCVCSF